MKTKQTWVLNRFGIFFPMSEDLIFESSFSRSKKLKITTSEQIFVILRTKNNQKQVQQTWLNSKLKKKRANTHIYIVRDHNPNQVQQIAQ